jgi:hypothetical protein
MARRSRKTKVTTNLVPVTTRDPAMPIGASSHVTAHSDPKIVVVEDLAEESGWR